MNETQGLVAALKSAPTILKRYTRELEALNLKLQKQVAKLYAGNLSKDHLIVSLKGELKKRGYQNISAMVAERLRSARRRVPRSEGHRAVP